MSMLKYMSMLKVKVYVKRVVRRAWKVIVPTAMMYVSECNSVIGSCVTAVF